LKKLNHRNAEDGHGGSIIVFSNKVGKILKRIDWEDPGRSHAFDIEL
jgi:hypothetical protein